jgi:hypothetical protein
MAVRTWVWITIAVLSVLVVGCFAVVGTGIYVVSRQVNVTETSEQAALEEMQQVRARFEGQPPLLARDEHGEISDAELRRRADLGSARTPDTMHVMVWDSSENRLVRLSIPFWMMRLGGTGSYTVDLGEGGVRLDKLRVSPDDLGRAGPGLVLDHQEGRNRILLWTE